MDIKLAKISADSKVEKITLSELESKLSQNSLNTIFLDRENTDKTMKALIAHFEKKGRSAHFHRIKFGLGENDYTFEVHII